MTKSLDLYLVGVGGQGILTIADFVCQAAMAADLTVSYFPTKGMSQRGGFVKAQIRLGKSGYGPSIPAGTADVAIAMESSEALKALRFLKADGEFVLYGGIWQPTDVMLKKAPYPATDEIKAAITADGVRLTYANSADLPLCDGKRVRENLFTLGLAMGGSRLGELLSIERMAELIAAKWPKAQTANLLAFNTAIELAQKQR